MVMCSSKSLRFVTKMLSAGNYDAEMEKGYDSNNNGEYHNSGWVLYYSPEGYPYYYNEYTGESQWAEYDYDENENENEGQNKQHDPDEDLDLERDREEDNTSPSQHYSDNESVNTEEYEEMEFQEYLQSEAGKRVYEEERQRLEEYFNSKNLTEENYSSEEAEENEKQDDRMYTEHYRTSRNQPQLQPQEDYYYSRNQNPYSNTSRGQMQQQQMTPQQVSQFISTYGLPPPPNKYSPRKARLPGMGVDPYTGVGSIMSTPRGMRIGRKQESLGPDIEGGEDDTGTGGGLDVDDDNDDDNMDSISKKIPQRTKKTSSKISKKRHLDIDPEDETDPDLQIIKQPVIPLWLSTVLNEMYHQFLRIPVVYVIQSLASSSITTISNPVTFNTVNDPLQLSDIVLNENDSESPGQQEDTTSATATVNHTIWDYLNDAARYLVEGKFQPHVSTNESQDKQPLQPQQQQESHPP